MSETKTILTVAPNTFIERYFEWLKQVSEHTQIDVDDRMLLRRIMADADKLRAQVADLTASHARLKEERDTARAMLDSLIADVKQAGGDEYAAIVDEAKGDISVNTAIKLVIRKLRQESR